VKTKKEYIIPFIGLKLGFHEFEFEIHDAFFEDREYSIIHNGNVNVKLVFEKKGTMMIGEFTIKGTHGQQRYSSTIKPNPLYDQRSNS